MRTVRNIKLPPVQAQQLRDAYQNSWAVLNHIKQFQLKGEAVAEMKDLEVAVQNIQTLLGVWSPS